MEDEVDVDIEGDDFNCNAPWELDSSISPENREAIERMLMEETRWSKQEKELFEKGLAQYGRRWTKIAKLVDTRSVLQVKSYARQYFKQKAKSDSGAAAPPKQQHQPPPSTMINTVRIERLSDDEDVDITDDLEKDQEDEDEEVEELKAPEQETEMDTETITEDEKQAIPEFFEGRPSKTPERYLKIRNYILDQRRSKPKYLNKTSVRPGLKNCGDVNCIGRIHTYLELIGAINFNCQAVYNRPKLVDRSKSKEGKEVLEAYQLAQRLQSMRTRKRRVRDVWGNWCDARDLEGQTYERSIDPFMLIPCRSFEKDVQHAHVSRGEVIGLLGGTFNKEEKILEICAAEPCNSVSTGLQCEMDPLSQTQACDVLSSLGFSVVGWYHSHPSFQPNPSVRDINTQDQFQSYFSRGGAPFIGMIVSPYDSANTSPHSQITCLLVKESKEPSGQNLPYRFNFLSSQNPPDWKQTMRRAQWIIQKYAQSHRSVQMDRLFRRDSSLTCLEK
uniref:Myb-like, SWIRM and MPN domain-containing protein 1 n=1 Tax=Cyprinodon variegatus TaxID=28743 RepID=A0A3Q2FYB7_CYPVA